MKRFAYLTMLVACALALFSCKSGGGGSKKSSGGGDGGGDVGATKNEMVVAGDTPSTKDVIEAPDFLSEGVWGVYKKGESDACLFLWGKATPSGHFDVSGGYERNKFCSVYGGTYMKTGPDTGVLYLSHNDEEEITERYLAGITPITYIPTYGTRVVGTNVTKHTIEIKMRFISKDGTRGSIESFIYKVNGVPRYTLSDGIFSSAGAPVW